MGYVGFYLTRQSLNNLKPELKAQFVGYDQVAHLWAAFLISYLVGQFLVSAFGRRTSSRSLLLTGLGISIAVNLLCAVTKSYSLFMLLMVVNGLAQAITGRSSPENRPRTQS